LSHAAADPIGIALHVARDFLLLHFPKGVAQFGGGRALGALQIANRVLQPLFQFLQVAEFAFFLLGELFRLVTRDAAGILAKGAAHLAFEVLLFASEIISLFGKAACRRASARLP
jgi:hypothetical protein